MAKKVEKTERKFSPVTAHDYEVVLEPIVSEKSMRLLQDENKVTVKVANDANATAIKMAFEAIFNVKVEKINTCNVRARTKKVGRHEGIVSGYKKAIVKLAEGETLDLFAAENK